MVGIEPERVVTVGCTESSAAATQKAVSADTAYGVWCSGSTLGTLERCQRPVPVRSSNLLLVLDTPSAGGEGPVVWNVIRTHTRSRNTCNVKSGRLPVYLGLDPAFLKASTFHFE